VDVDKTKINTIKEGKSPIHEEGLEPLLRLAARKKTLTLSHEHRGLARAKIIFITVGTPSKDDGSIDTEFVESASREIGRQLSSARGYHVVVVKSTVTPGTTENLVRPVLEKESGKRAGKGFGLASNPEFLHEGSAVRETLHPEAVVIGGHDRKSTSTLLGLYESFYGKPFPSILTTPSNAEMIKYAINAGRATQLSFVNTVANLCTRTPGCDYDEVRKALSLIGRMDERYLKAGMGFGGSCLPKDTRALSAALRPSGASDDLIASAMKVNAGQVDEVMRMAQRHCGSLDGKRVGVLGLAFKSGTDDVRESVSIALVRALIKTGAEVCVYDPTAVKNAKHILGSQVSYARSARECIRSSECVFIATGWDSFKSIRPGDFKSLMKTPVVIDGRRLYDQEPFRRAGVKIETVGTGPSTDQTSGETGSKSATAREWRYVVREGKVHVVDGPA
jgi:UDPglucose 6-dehydrogenase